ncbi:MAG: hypothetical protein LBT51_06800 [Fusobacteriaceae bacterium]|jgi:hypothetical protein|nr:hypothetical protein [Fusobacteriaceae bacterium]
MEKNYIIYIGIAVILLLILFIIRKSTKSHVMQVDDIIKSYYYRYGGEINWIKFKLENYKFKSLSSMLSCKNAEEADFKIEIMELEDGTKKMNVYATEFSYKGPLKAECIIKNLVITEEQYNQFLLNAKDTYIVMEDEITENNKNK